MRVLNYMKILISHVSMALNYAYLLIPIMLLIHTQEKTRGNYTKVLTSCYHLSPGLLKQLPN